MKLTQAQGGHLSFDSSSDAPLDDVYISSWPFEIRLLERGPRDHRHRASPHVEWRSLQEGRKYR